MDINLDPLKVLKGLIATVTLTGTVKPLFAQSLSNMRDVNSRNGLVNIEYKLFEAKLVEAGRDAVCLHALKNDYQWIIMIDADAGPFPDDTTIRLLHTMFTTNKHLDVLGVYAQLKQAPHLPVIDTGTGTWEPWMPGAGLIEVIRTGGHFIMINTRILKKLAAPWFRTRIPYSPVKAFKELDNFARCKSDGNNPLTEHPEWATLMMQAIKESTPGQDSHIGEDSGFCDYVKSVGGRIAVDTDIVAGHIGTKVIQPEDLKKFVKEDSQRQYAQMGVLNYD